MDLTTLTEQVLANRPEALATSSVLGLHAVAALANLANDPLPSVRVMALRCLDVIGGPQASAAALARLADDDEEVISAALQVLHRWPPAGREKELLVAFEASHGEFTRLEVPLVAGRLAPAVDPRPWKLLWVKETAGDVKQSLMVALARMGDAQARDQFVQNLQTMRGPDAAAWIDRCTYMQDRWIVPHLTRLLASQEIALKLFPDWPGSGQLRVCDLAATAIVELTGAKVPFAVQRETQFAPAEIEHVRRIAAGVK